jgi:shikimate dehydrogenase
VGIFGDPVAHSLSPAMHNAAFAALGLDMTYVPFWVRPTDLAAAVRGARALGLAGFNVTVPHKERILPLLDTVSAEARILGAVNTVARRGHRLVGYNTDGGGFLDALVAARVPVRGRTALLIGAGGAARAVAHALLRAGCRALVIANRTHARARRLRHHLGARRGRVAVVPWAALGDAALLQTVNLLVNGTSLGLGGEAIRPLALGATPPGCVVVDIVYGSRVTPLVAAARRAGRRVIDGRGMLLHQGARAFTLWTGRRAPLGVMAAALGRALAGHAPALTRPRPAAIRASAGLGRRRR